MTEGGTEKPGVSPSAFRMPEGLSIRYDEADPAIADAISGYHVYAVDTTDEKEDWFLPGTANIRVTLDGGPLAYSVRRRTYNPLPPVALFGPTSQAMRAVHRGGMMIGFSISALGWWRLIPRAASDFRDRVVPLSDVLPPAFAEELRKIVTATDRAHEVKPALDALLIRHMGPPHPDSAQIRRLMALIVEDDITSLARLTQEMGVPGHTLRRLSARHFGFPPKMLLLRARFLRTFTSMVREGNVLDYSHIGAGYYDASHFLRDARAFLGTTPRRFMAQGTTFLQASLRARKAVLGAPLQALSGPEPEMLDALGATP